MDISLSKIQAIDLQARQLDYSLRRYYVDLYNAEQVAGLRAGSKVLDLAGNKVKKRGQFNVENYGLDVLYANLSPEKKPDVQSDAASLPFSNESFDAVICSELLEHVTYPPSVLREAFRVLKKGGTILVCVPFIYQIHGDPYDFGRYTDHYWLKYFLEIGYKNIEIKKQGLFWSVLIDMLRAWLSYLQVNDLLKFKKLVIPVMAFAKRTALAWDADKVNNQFFSSFTTGFGIKAVK